MHVVYTEAKSGIQSVPNMNLCSALQTFNCYLSFIQNDRDVWENQTVAPSYYLLAPCSI